MAGAGFHFLCVHATKAAVLAVEARWYKTGGMKAGGGKGYRQAKQGVCIHSLHAR